MSGTEFSESAQSLGPTPDDVAQNYSYRERYENEETVRSDVLEGTSSPAISGEAVAALVSPAAHQLIIDFEVGGREGYAREFCHPCRPPNPSGVTIGFGYDLGYYKPSEFDADWKALLSPEDQDRLRPAIGIKGDPAQALLTTVKHIVVPMEAAETVYRQVTVPKYGRQTLGIFTGSDALHPHCFGALLSLVYNRGSDLRGDRRLEMRNIREAMIAGKPEAIPHEFRAMKRLWPNIKGLQRRREAEANLFERGLIEMNRAHRAVPIVVASASTPAIADRAADERGLHESTAGAGMGFPPNENGDLSFSPDQIYDEQSVPGPGPLERAQEPAEWRHVRWIEDDNLSTEYRHILPADRTNLKEASFLFAAQDLELLIAANGFATQPNEPRIIFGLRGTLLEHDGSSPDERFAQVNRQSLRLKVTRPDHENFRCVIGVYNRETGMLSGFTASTVPNRAIVYQFFKQHDQGNMLACGCYRYIVGAHHNGRYPGCLRQDEPSAVLRSHNDPVYDVGDAWDVQNDPPPMDNIHPAFGDKTGSSEFSSFGCQVIRGGCPEGSYTKEFAKFRSALGLKSPGTDNGRKVSYVLLTGQEAAIATQLRKDGRDTDHAAVRDGLVRIRQGSTGEAVRHLQAALKQKVTGTFSARDKQVLAEVQRQVAGPQAGDGVFSPAFDQAWGRSIFGDDSAGPAAPATIVLASASGRSRSLETLNQPGDARLDAVFYEVGRRAAFARTAPELLATPVLPHYEAITKTSWADHVALGRSIVARLDRMAHELICGDQASENADRQQIHHQLAKAMAAGPSVLTPALSAVLTGWLMVPPIVATPFAEILVQKFWPAITNTRSGSPQDKFNAFCAAWGAQLFREAVANDHAAPHAQTPQSPANVPPASAARTA